MSIQKSIISQRLKLIREKSGLSTNRFSEILGIAQPSWTRLENGQVEPRTKTIISLIEKFSVDPLWLLTGRTKEQVTSPTALKLAEVADKLSEESRQRFLEQAQRELMLEEILRDQKTQKASCE